MSTAPVQKRLFGTTRDGKPVDAYVLGLPSGLSVEIITFGATVTRILAPGKDGRPADVVLGFDDVASYAAPGPYFGATVGRYGNRVAYGMFPLDGVTYKLARNDNGAHHLHGGTVGYDKRLWKANEVPGGVRFSLVDADGTEGYPGTVTVSVTFTLTAENGLRIAYEATTDKPTPINLTNHSYFNLAGVGASAPTIHDHVLQLWSDGYTSVDGGLIPTGKVEPVEGTPLDFRHAKPIGRHLAENGAVGGYDHNFTLGKAGEFRRAAFVHHPGSGRTMEVWTDQPAVQLYTGNFLDGSSVGKHGIRYPRHSAFCLETQHYPDSPNHPAFPTTTLKPGQTYRTTTEYRFGVR